MRSANPNRSPLWAACAIATALFVVGGGGGGCGSSTREVKAPPVQQEAVARTSSSVVMPAPAPVPAAAPTPSVAQFKADLAQTSAEIDRALATLRTLTNPQTPPSQLRSTFDAYGDQLARMTQRQEQLKREAEQMRDSRAAYFARWEEKAAEIDNPSIRASVEARKSRLRAAHERITTASLSARDAYEPFMRDLQDVRKYLAADLTPASVQMLGDVDKKAASDGAVVKQRIADVIAELDAVERGTPQ